MKILKIFGIVVGIHVFLLVLVFAIPGCSSTAKPVPSVADTAPKPAAPPPIITVPLMTPTDAGGITPTVIAFNPDAPAAPAPFSVSTSGVRLVPTRPDSPVAGVLVAQAVEGVTPATSYIVKSGDNLWTIAKKNNLTVPQLTAANQGISTTTNLRPGQKLIIPSRSVAPLPAATAKAADAATAAATMSGARSNDAMKHTVKPGETLGTIARNYGVKQGDIAVANNILDPAKIRAGMELTIPGWQPTGAKSGKAPAKSGASPKAGDTKAPASVALPAVPDSAPPAPPVTPPVPVIKIDEGPSAPAPKR